MKKRYQNKWFCWLFTIDDNIKPLQEAASVSYTHLLRQGKNVHQAHLFLLCAWLYAHTMIKSNYDFSYAYKILDVYKRQAQAWAVDPPPPARAHMLAADGPGGRAHPVSYTHLDVYKRQSVPCRRRTAPRPDVAAPRFRGCGVCMKNCAHGAIAFDENRKAGIDHGKCCLLYTSRCV